MPERDPMTEATADFLVGWAMVMTFIAAVASAVAVWKWSRG